MIDTQKVSKCEFFVGHCQIEKLSAQICGSVAWSGERQITAPRGSPQNWLIDLRPVFLLPTNLTAIASWFWSNVSIGDAEIQIAGMEVAAIPLLTGLLVLAPDSARVNGLMIRKERKPTGLCNAIEGKITGDSAILVDDIINSGDSAEKARVVLAEAGVSVSEMFVVIDYQSRRGMEWRKKHGIKVTSLFTLKDFANYGDMISIACARQSS